MTKNPGTGRGGRGVLRKPIRQVVIKELGDGTMVGKVPLPNGNFATIDIEDIQRIGKHNWYQSRVGYVIRKAPRPDKHTVWLHREIINPPEDRVVDHIDMDKLNNRRGNLRPCTHSQNLFNRSKEKGNKSGFKGVNWLKANRKWRAEININRVNYHLGLFDSPEAAHKAYERAAKHLHGEFARAA